MNKEIDLLKVALQLGGIRLALDAILGEVWDKLPEKDGGFPSVRSDFIGLGKRLFDEQLMQAISEYTSGEINTGNLPIPEPEPEPTEPDPEPEEEMYGFGFKEEGKHKGPIHISGHYPQRFVWPKDGPEYGKKIMIMAEDGQKMYVNDTKKGYEIGKGNRKYVAGYPYFKSNDPSQPHQTMEYYADYGTKPKRAWVYYGKPQGSNVVRNKVS